MQHTDKRRDNALLKELLAEADNFEWRKERRGSVPELVGQTRNRKLTSSSWDPYARVPLHCVLQNTAANDTFLCWVLEFLNTGAARLIAAFGNALCYLSVTSDDDFFLL